MLVIVNDERRRNRPKSISPYGVVMGSSLDIVASLVRATGPTFAPRLASKLPMTITIRQSGQERL